MDEQMRRLVFRGFHREEPMVTIENDRLKLAVVPGLGGRAVRLIDKRDGHNYFEETPEADTLDSIGQAYFNYGGYEEYVGRAFAGPGWELPFRVQVGDTAMLLTAVTGDWELRRLYELDGNQLIIQSHLTNIPAERTNPHTDRYEQLVKPRPMMLRTHPQFTLGGDSQNWQVHMKDKQGNWQTSSPSAEHDGPRMPVAGHWKIHDPDTGRTLQHTFDSKQADAYFFHGDAGDYVQMELFGKPQTLKLGDSITLWQVFTIGDEPPSTERTKLRIYDRDVSGMDDQTGGFFTWFKLPEDVTAQDAAKPVILFSMGRNNPDWMYFMIENDQLVLVNERVAGGQQAFEGDYVRVAARLPEALERGRLYAAAVSWQCNDDGLANVQLCFDDELLHEAKRIRWPGPGFYENIALGDSSAKAGVGGPVELFNTGWTNGIMNQETLRQFRDMKPIVATPKTLDYRLNFLGNIDQRVDTIEAILRR